MCKIVFDNRIDYEFCYDNYMYNHEKTGQVLVFAAYDMIAKLGIIYVGTPEYSDLLLSSERQRLLARNLLRGPKSAVKQTRACEKVFNNFALQT